jgi:hypothetical protein
LKALRRKKSIANNAVVLFQHLFRLGIQLRSQLMNAMFPAALLAAKAYLTATPDHFQPGMTASFTLHSIASF